jgi:hypothetical protein
MKRFAGFFFGTVFRPNRAFAALQNDPKRVAKGFRAVFMPGFLFAVTAGLLAFGGALIVAPPLLPLAGVNYYFYQMFFALPVFLLGWALATAFARAFGKWRGGGASYKGTLAALGFAFGLPALAAWIPQAVFAALTLLGMGQDEFMDLTARPGLQRTIAFGVQGLVAVWTVFLSAAAVRAGLRLRWAKALPVGLLTAAAFLGFLLVFIR